MQDNKIEEMLNRLNQSKFRNKKRLAGAIIPNDGKQTPMKGHPVFIAQHATATCCRDCLYKWHKIEKNKELLEEEIDYIVQVIMIWIEKEID